MSGGGDEEEADLLTPAELRTLKRGLLRTLATAASKGNASAALAALKMAEPNIARRNEERDAILAWMRACGGGPAEAVDHFWPGLEEQERIRRINRVKQWVHRFPAEARPADDPMVPTPDLPPRPEADYAWADMDRVPFLRKQLAELLADIKLARQIGRMDRVSQINGQITEVSNLLFAARREESGIVVVDRNPAAVADEMAKRQKEIDALRAAFAASQRKAKNL